VELTNSTIHTFELNTGHL